MLDVDGLMSSGWTYYDLPKRLSFEMWDYFISLLGEGNYKILIISQNSAEDWKRGQFLISPAGIQRLRERRTDVR